MKFSIVAVAYGDYARFIPEFLEHASRFSDDIIIETKRQPMGTMRNKAIAKAKYPYIVSLDIDDLLMEAPDTFGDFVGLSWVEQGENYTFWLPGERRNRRNTTRSNILFSKALWDKIPFIDHDYYIDEFIRQAYLSNTKFNKTKNACVLHTRWENSVSDKFSLEDKEYRDAVAMHKELMKTVRNAGHGNSKV